MPEQKLRTVGVVLFEGFELLDVYGPLEVWNGLSEIFRVVTVGERVGPISPSRGPAAPAGGPQTLVAQSFASCEPIEKRPCSSDVCPKECAHGRNESDRSSRSIGKTSCTALTFDARFACERTTPFGLPVVPLV